MANLVNAGELYFWQDPSLQPMKHGFFTRLGGVSTGAIAGLNCGRGADDAAQNVTENRTRIQNALESSILPQTVFQHHSSDVITISSPLEDNPKADALVTKTPGLPIAVLTADCAPILFADHRAKVIGAAHAGWRGAFGGVIENTLAAMELLGANRGDIQAVVGACISMNNYEVGAEFVEQFTDEDPRFSQYFSGSEKIHFNLPRFVLDHLREAGVGNADWIGECTYADAHNYYSYRRSTHKKEADYGRLMSAIMIPA